MTARLRLSAIALVSALAAAAPAQAGKLYKWVDADGNVTYSQQRPPGQQAEAIRLRSATLSAEGAQEKLDNLTGKASEQQKDREFAQNSATAKQERSERLANNCKIARENMRILKNSSRIQDKDAEGQPYFLDEAGIQAKIAQTQQQIDDNCNP
ncbi:MAG: DUF4124 domain-containing protein [Gammaproteobacteria bacterium]|nr:DUF4124 domain-containing protein [Gammaproteobacteria bacterium]NIM72857.1 DUF4124 domain-containing protein [Gammaproteobacteria bacterium]NIN38315.1 DUF4124 domain-containing protein [Gammaproteobacteria bacterium]NIO24605.1 DUF4124 domain-containing protein [Gammaproteobacteria bacterium]NIO65214.1 DUF4124 domain-containing protein [Gammaproteobacteria bacterium]